VGLSLGPIQAEETYFRGRELGREQRWKVEPTLANGKMRCCRKPRQRERDKARILGGGETKDRHATVESRFRDPERGALEEQAGRTVSESDHDAPVPVSSVELASPNDSA